MIEIDIIKATDHNKRLPPPSCYSNDDTDNISEPDTALNTPTGSLTDSNFSISKRYSSFASYNVSSYKQKKLSFTSPLASPQQIELLEKKIQALENDLAEHVKREVDLQSHVFYLTEKQKGVPNGQYRSTLTRISKQIDRFLVTQQHQPNNNNDDNDNNWIGSEEIPTLYDGYRRQNNNTATDNNNNDDMSNFIAPAAAATTSIPIVLIYRLKSMLDDFTTITNNQPVIDFCTELSRTLNSWQEFYNKELISAKEHKRHEQRRVTRLLEALQKSLLKNKLMRHDHTLLMEKYKADMKHIVNQVNQQNWQRQPEKGSKQQDFIQTKALLESQIRELEKELYMCQDERSEFETTLEMVRREMEAMLEELEDTKQQRVQYKTQVSRLRAGLEAIQKKREAKKKCSHSDGEEDDSSNDDEEDEGKEAIRLMFNEAERQAIDLDRECKRQALTLTSIRQELKLTEEKLQTIKTEKNKELEKLQRINQKLNRDVEMLQVEKDELILLEQQMMSSSSSSSQEDDIHHAEAATAATAKIYALQIALKAAKSDAVIHRTKTSQLERQSIAAELIHPNFVAGLQDLFQKELAASVLSEKQQDLKELSEIIEMEQKLWKHSNLKSFQKNYDIDLLRVNRELRFLTCKLNDLEDETAVLKTRHLEEISLLKYQSNAEFEKRIQQLTCKYRLKEQELKNELEILFQKNQTLQDESLILYGRNMLMAHQLGKITS